jgi:death on curing protein
MLFLRKDELLELHVALISTFGGIEGLRDEPGFESALAAPEQRAYYEEADLAVCAATYAYHLTKAHAFLDGNKRIAAAATELFVRLNNARLVAPNQSLIEFFLLIADGSLTRDAVEQQLQLWIELER